MKSAAGFTLIEMLISLSIFGIITGFVMANFRAGSQSDELRASSLIVAGVIRRAQTAALTGETAHFCRDEAGTDGRICNSNADCGTGTCVNDVPRGGYGVHFETAEANKRFMVSFADTNGNGAFDATEQYRRDSVSANIFVSVNSLNPINEGVLDIVFVPPRPAIKFNNSTGEPIATIILKHRSTNNTKTITVNSLSGQVSAD
jgi:prepilin-type N-terminal cleavage/methylation domain-containing protein